MTGEHDSDDDVTNPPAGDTTDRPFSDEEVRDLLRGAELLRYSEGTEEHSGNVMAVFRTPEGRGIGVTMRDTSRTPEDLIGETVREERPFVRNNTPPSSAYILFEDRDPATEKIAIKHTYAMGIYEVDLDDEEQPDEPELRTDGGKVTSVSPRWTLPENHYYGRTVERGPWHIFDDDERRSLCGIYNDDGVTRGSNRGLSSSSLPSDVCGSCVGAADYLELVEETEEVEFEDADDVQREHMIEAVENSDGHSDLKAYVEKAYDRGGTALLSSMRYLVSVHGVEDGVDRWYGLGTPLEKALYKGGAEGALNSPHPADVTNEEIFREIMEEGR